MSTTVEITDAEEFRIICDALAAYRKDKLQRQVHKGLYISRLDLPCESTTRETAFMNRWRKENDRNFPREPTLAALIRDVPTDREVEVVATVIQWLGTNVGFSFVCEALADCGYRVKKLINPEADGKKS